MMTPIIFGRIGNGLPIEFDAILIALWRADKFEDDAETSFIYWPIAELKLVYSVLQEKHSQSSTFDGLFVS